MYILLITTSSCASLYVDNCVEFYENLYALLLGLTGIEGKPERTILFAHLFQLFIEFNVPNTRLHSYIQIFFVEFDDILHICEI